MDVDPFYELTRGLAIALQSRVRQRRCLALPGRGATRTYTLTHSSDVAEAQQ